MSRQVSCISKPLFLSPTALFQPLKSLIVNVVCSLWSTRLLNLGHAKQNAASLFTEYSSQQNLSYQWILNRRLFLSLGNLQCFGPNGAFWDDMSCGHMSLFACTANDWFDLDDNQCCRVGVGSRSRRFLQGIGVGKMILSESGVGVRVEKRILPESGVRVEKYKLNSRLPVLHKLWLKC